MLGIHSSPKVLIIDDDQFQIDLFSVQLARHGVAEVIGFLTGFEALRYLAANKFDYPLLFLDLNMPEMDGVEFVRKLVETAYTGALALVSGEDCRVIDSVAKLASAHQLDVVGILAKPVNNEALSTTIASWQAHHLKRHQIDGKLYGAEEIRQALDEHQTINHYQPKVSLADGKLCGVEALVRWQHPTDGLVFPNQIIGPAEQYGLIDELTTIVLIEALEQHQRWSRQGLICPVAVNLSMDSLVRLEFPNFVQDQLSRLGIRTENLVLEITESRLPQNMTLPLDILTRLRIKRIALSIDDFGTGHSSLAQLRDLPFNELKLDRSFVHGAANNATQGAIVEANIRMAKQLSIKVVGEGIEDASDWKFLRDLNCDLGQGYFIAKPMPGTEVADWSKAWSKRIPKIIPKSTVRSSATK